MGGLDPPELDERELMRTSLTSPPKLDPELALLEYSLLLLVCVC